MTTDDLVFVGFNSRVAALHRDSGEIVWQWKSRKGSGYVTLLLDGDRLIASVNGYTYCLDPATGDEMWFNEMSGFGTGVAVVASARGGVAGNTAAEADRAQRAHAAASAGG